MSLRHVAIVHFALHLWSETSCFSFSTEGSNSFESKFYLSEQLLHSTSSRTRTTTSTCAYCSRRTYVRFCSIHWVSSSSSSDNPIHFRDVCGCARVGGHDEGKEIKTTNEEPERESQRPNVNQSS